MSDIKDLINSKIKENGNGEITGKVLNEVLNAMVDAGGGELNIPITYLELKDMYCLYIQTII